MPSEPFLVTVDRPDGVSIMRKVPACSDADLEVARPYGEQLLELCGGDPGLLCVLLIEHEHEQRVYERVCERKGLLPL